MSITLFPDHCKMTYDVDKDRSIEESCHTYDHSTTISIPIHRLMAMNRSNIELLILSSISFPNEMVLSDAICASSASVQILILHKPLFHVQRHTQHPPESVFIGDRSEERTPEGFC